MRYNIEILGMVIKKTITRISILLVRLITTLKTKTTH